MHLRLLLEEGPRAAGPLFAYEGGEMEELGNSHLLGGTRSQAPLSLIGTL